MQVLVINSGSSSVKFELFEMEPERALLEGEVERIGQAEPGMWVEDLSASAPHRVQRPVRAADHREALLSVLEALRSAESPADLSTIVAVGHRVVHGGSRFTAPTRIDGDVLDGIRSFELLAPVHAKANVAGIEAARAAFPDVCHVAVFDTSFHSTIPAVACEYALPRAMAKRYGIRRYGFHGISHEYVARRAALLLGRDPETLDLISLHLGNGASVAAIRGGKSIDTSMGMTPLEGLVMGTRCGDVDPAVPGLIGEISGRSREEVNRVLNFESGLKGLCGESDIREVHALAAIGDKDAELAVDMFCYRAKKYIGAYYAALGRLDAVVFTAGIGENDALVRARICDGLVRLGIEVDPARNSAADAGERVISADGCEVAVMVIPTDEEFELARAAVACADQSTD